MKVLSYWFVLLVSLMAFLPATHIPLSAVYSPGALLLLAIPLVSLVICQVGVLNLPAWLGRMFRMELSQDDQILVGRLNSGALLLSGTGVILGLIHVLRNLANPDLVGPGIAVVFVTMIYGALVPLLLLPFTYKQTAKVCTREAAAFAFLVCPFCIGLSLSALHLAKVF